jgi:hypothetical protein
MTQLKTLAELQTEIESGAVAQANTNQEITVYKNIVDSYDRDENGHKTVKTVYMLSLPGRSQEGIGQGMGYLSLDDLISDALIPEVTAPVWSVHQ